MSKKVMYGEQRKQQILGLIKEKKSVSVNELAQYFDVTTATIRTDLTELEKAGEVIRTHGGAILKSDIAHEKFLNERENEDKKIKVAFKAIELIEEEDSILIDTGTSTAALARILANSDIKRLRIFTNDFEIAKLLENKSEFDVHVLGGRIRKGFHYSYGGTAISELRKYKFDKLFLATSCLSFDNGLTTYHTETADLKVEMINCASQKILLADSTKMNKVSFAKFADLKEIDAVVVDNEVSKFDYENLTEAVDTVIMA
ncbi:DeoR/GlpR family DNA-binding transcription regulator [Vibrio sp. HN007]|uniref:DeoR/GlpR family DNA-binding transcription regulator n=1 Tax=Vibrio iocasae TaxID=3098914 RepID=UPI0035D4F99A